MLSLNDTNTTVKNAAENVLISCFDESKRSLIDKNFGKLTIDLCVEIINKKHKLVLPQK